MSARATRKRTREDSAAEVQEELPVRKRSQTVEALPALPEPAGDGSGLKRDEEFWLEDGTVILVARDVEFRVYSGILASHSPVFKDKFAEDHPTRNVSMNGKFDIPCPVVQLSDSPEDLRHLLRVYVPRSDHSLYDAKEPSYDVISASIRLGHKYQLASLYEQSLRYLKSHFTNDLSKWCSVESWAPESWSDADAIGVVNLARLIGEPTLLPTAIMGCNTLADGIVRGVEREDGSQEYLTLEDLGICFRFKSEIRKESLKVLLQTLQPVTARDCKSPSICRELLRSALAGLHEYTSDIIDKDPFMSWTGYVRDEKLDLCTACLAIVDERDLSGRRKLWERLPEVLGIEVPGWVEPVLADTQT